MTRLLLTLMLIAACVAQKGDEDQQQFDHEQEIEHIKNTGFFTQNETVSAGMVVSFGKDFLEEKHVWFAESLLAKVGDFFKSNAIPLEGMTLNHLMFRDLPKTFEAAQQSMKLGPNGVVKGSLWDLNDLVITFDYQLTATKEWGAATVTIKNFSLNYEIQAMKGESSRLQFKLIKIKAASNPKILITGSPEDFLKFKIIEELNNSLFADTHSSETLQGIQDLVNGRILNLHQTEALYGGKMHMDYTLVSEGIRTTSEYLSFMFDGTFYSGHIPAQRNETSLPRIPVFRRDLKSFQIIMSEESLQSLVSSTAKLGWLDSQRSTTSERLNVYLDGFEDAFGEHDKVRIVTKPDTEGAYMNIADDDGIVTMGSAIHMNIKNPFYNSDQDVASVKLKLVADVQFRLTNKYLMKGNVVNMESSVQSFTPYFRTQTNQMVMKTQMALISPYFSEYLNTLGDAGIELPLPQKWKDQLKHPSLTTDPNEPEGFFVLHAEPTEHNSWKQQQLTTTFLN